METIQNYTLYRVIGNGSFGVVHYAKDENNFEFAIKKIKTTSISKSQKKLIETETKVLQSLKISSVIRLYDIITTEEALYLVTDYCKGGDLESFMLKRKTISEDRKKHWIKTIISTLIQLKNKNILHRDLKKANILLTDSDPDTAEIKLCDFGLSKELNPGSVAQSRVGTPINMAPEILEGQNYSFKADVWSLGILCYEILLGVPLFSCYNLEDLKTLQKNSQFLDNDKLSEEAKSFLGRMIVFKEEDRADYEELICHEFLAEEFEILDNSIDSEKIESEKKLIQLEDFKFVETNEKIIFQHPENYQVLNDIENEYKKVKIILDVRAEKLNFFQEIMEYVQDDVHSCYIIHKYLETSYKSMLYAIEIFEEKFLKEPERFKSEKSFFQKSLSELEIQISLVLKEFPIEEQDTKEALINKIMILKEDSKIDYSKFLSLAGHVLYPSDDLITGCYYSAWS
jgi:serine/threonine protein kinase